MSEIGRKNIRRHASVSGRVQGVGFRWHCQRAACARGLAGWVRNTHDGSVELEVEGPVTAVEAFLEEVEAGPSGARVTGLTVFDEPLVEEDSFRIRFDA